MYTPYTQVHDRAIARLVAATSIESEWLANNQNPKSKKDRQHNDQMKQDKWTNNEQSQPD